MDELERPWRSAVGILAQQKATIAQDLIRQSPMPGGINIIKTVRKYRNRGTAWYLKGSAMGRSVDPYR
jgi:hypothetical protein